MTESNQKYPCICKVFTNNKWHVLGRVYASSLDEAWNLAHDKWSKVNSVYWL